MIHDGVAVAGEHGFFVGNRMPSKQFSLFSCLAFMGVGWQRLQFDHIPSGTWIFVGSNMPPKEKSSKEESSKEEPILVQACLSCLHGLGVVEVALQLCSLGDHGFFVRSSMP